MERKHLIRVIHLRVSVSQWNITALTSHAFDHALLMCCMSVTSARGFNFARYPPTLHFQHQTVLLWKTPLTLWILIVHRFRTYVNTVQKYTGQIGGYITISTDFGGMKEGRLLSYRQAFSVYIYLRVLHKDQFSLKHLLHNYIIH